MVSFEITVRHPSGFNAEVAGQLVREAIKCTGKVTIEKGEKRGDAKLIFHVMSLSLKRGEKAKLTVEGSREQEEAASLKKYIDENL